jgi:hypothetical protein
MEVYLQSDEIYNNTNVSLIRYNVNVYVGNKKYKFS